MRSLQSIAVVRGKPCLYGDAQLALIRHSGKLVHFKEYYLYEKKGKLALTLIGPDEWKSPYGTCIAKVRQLGDSTWEEVYEQ